MGGIVFVFVDINEFKKIQKQLKFKADELEISNNDLAQFAYLAAHDLKAPITNIESLIGFIEQDQHILDDGLVVFGRLKESVRRMKLTIDALNEVISIKKNLDIVPEKIHFEEVLKNVHSIIGEQISTSNTIINIDFELAPKLLSIFPPS